MTKRSTRKVEKLWRKSVDVQNINRFTHMAKLATRLLENEDYEVGIPVGLEAWENRWQSREDLQPELAYQLSAALISESRHDEAEIVLSNLLYTFDDSALGNWKGLCLWQRAECYDLMNSELALHDYLAAGQCFVKHDSAICASRVWLQAAMLEADNCNYSHATELASKAVEVLRDNGLMLEAAKAMGILASILQTWKKTNMAIAHLEQALAITQHLRQDDESQKFHIQLGEIFQLLEDTAKAKYHLEAASQYMESKSQTATAVVALKLIRSINIGLDLDFEAYQIDQVLDAVDTQGLT